MDEKAAARWHVFFSGRVQHVGFRYTALYLARELYLTGWVRNCADGRVEMEGQGPVSRIRKLLLRLKGQTPIRIERMEVENLPVRAFDRKFEVLETV